MTRKLPLLMALACGVGVANVYFPQALTPLIADGLGVPPATAAIVATVTQLGYAVGIFLLGPLGDRLPRRPLITGLLATTGDYGAPCCSRSPSSAGSARPGPRWPCSSPGPATAWVPRPWGCWP